MESGQLSKLKKYQKKLKKLLNNDLIDIILFGSFVKAGTPADIDVALVVKDKNNTAEIKKKVREIINNADIELIDIESIYSPIWLTLIKEGFSVKKNKYLSDLYNIKPAVLYRFSLKRLSNVQKVQFERDKKCPEKGRSFSNKICCVSAFEYEK